MASNMARCFMSASTMVLLMASKMARHLVLNYQVLGIDDGSLVGFKDGPSLGVELGIDNSSSGVELGNYDDYSDGFEDGSSLGVQLGIDNGSWDGFEDGSSLGVGLCIDNTTASQ
jgi:hypothetical protein